MINVLAGIVLLVLFVGLLLLTRFADWREDIFDSEEEK